MTIWILYTVVDTTDLPLSQPILRCLLMRSDRGVLTERRPSVKHSFLNVVVLFKRKQKLCLTSALLAKQLQLPN